MTEQTADGETWRAALHSREHVRGNKPNAPEPHSHAGLVGDERVRALLSHLADHYDPSECDREMPARVEQTQLWQSLLGRASTETLSRAVESSNGSTMSYFVGSPGSESDISGLKAIGKLRDVVGVEAPIIYIKGEPGSGKTNIALLLAQLWRREQDGATELASNIRSLQDQDRWIESFSGLDEWATEGVVDLPDGGTTLDSDAPRRLYVFDEASSHAQGRGEQGYNAGMLLGPLVKKIRKGNAGIIIIGHDGKDVHPSVRVLAKVVERYVENKKRATLYQSIRERKGVDEIVSLSGVPQTDLTYDDKEATRFVWDMEDKDEQIEDSARELADDMVEQEHRRLAAELYLNDSLSLSQSDIGRAIGDYSQSWVSRAVESYQNEDKTQDGSGTEAI